MESVGIMMENRTEEQARKEILGMVAAYCDRYHGKKEYDTGGRIAYASRV